MMTEMVDGVPLDEPGTIGDDTIAHAQLRLACLQEARLQIDRDENSAAYPDILHRARWNARFVLEGRTPALKFKPSADSADA